MTDTRLLQFFGVNSWPKLLLQALCKSFASLVQALSKIASFIVVYLVGISSQLHTTVKLMKKSTYIYLRISFCQFDPFGYRFL